MSAIRQYLAESAGSPDLITDCFSEILDPSTDKDEITQFLVRLHDTKADRDPDVITKAVNVLRVAALKWPLADAVNLTTQGQALGTLTDSQTICVDIVGTGGDGHNTFNVSTAAAIVAAGVPGIRVIKHGNKASTSASGSADILKSYGCNLMLNPSDVPAISSKFLFLLAPIWNPALVNVAAIRKSLKHPTIFNILGPLLNPAPIEARVIGVHSPELGPVFVKSFSQLSPRGRCLVVCGHEGLDEISPAGQTHVWSYDAEHGIREQDIGPADFGLTTLHTLEDVKSGTPEENATVLASLLAGKFQIGHPILDYVLINCAALLVVSGVAKDYHSAVAQALESINSGAALRALDSFRDESVSVV